MDYKHRATKHIVQDKVGFMEFHGFPVGLRTIILGNNNKEDILGVGTYQLKLRERNQLLLHNTIYAPGVQCSLVSHVSSIRLGFTFGFHPNG